MPDSADLKREIESLKKERNALVLAHYYVPLEVQDVADAVCDSFAMAKKARAASESVIVICGVRFMGESAKILSPEKTVLLPVEDAGCPMADMVTPEDVMRMRREHPDAAVVCYVNSSAAVKAVSDACCTSSSALAIVNSRPEKEIIFVPDRHLGSFVQQQVPDKKLWLHEGYCPVHHEVSAEHVREVMRKHPGAALAVHPECDASVVALADLVGSTAEIIDFARDTFANELIIGTEEEIVKRLQRDMPGKKFYPAAEPFVCENMKKITLESLRDCLRDMRCEVELSPEDEKGALAALDYMVRS